MSNNGIEVFFILLWLDIKTEYVRFIHRKEIRKDGYETL